MKKHPEFPIILLFVMSMLIFQSNATAQEKSPDWIRQIKSYEGQAGYSIVADKNGNSFVTGSFTDTLQIAGQKLVSNGHSDIFIAAFSVQGDVKWLKQAGGTEADEAYGITLDAAGNVFITGYFSGTSDFSGKIMKSNASRDFFVAKYDKDGNFAWVRSGQVSNKSFATNICTDNNGNIFISGFFSGKMSVGNSSFESKKGNGLFLIKMNSDGLLQWFRSGGGDEKDEISAIHCDNKGNLYLTGSFEKEIRFDKKFITSSGTKDIFLAKFTPGGSIDWLRSGGSATGDDVSTSIDIDAEGSIFIAGYFSGTAFFSNKKLKSAGSDDVFLVKYNEAGDVIWAKQTGGQGNEHARALIIDDSGNIYVAGEFDFSFTFASRKIERKDDWDIFILKYTSDGSMSGSNVLSGAGYKKAESLGVDKEGNAFLLGYYIQEVISGDARLTSEGKRGSGFIAKISHFKGQGGK